MSKCGLIIKKQHLDNILNGKKNWEIRGSKTKKRGKIALIESGTGEIKGHADLVDCLGPLSKEEMLKSLGKHLISKDVILKGIRYKNVYAWVLKNAKRLSRPKKYKHPKGAIIWVNL